MKHSRGVLPKPSKADKANILMLTNGAGNQVWTNDTKEHISGGTYHRYLGSQQ